MAMYAVGDIVTVRPDLSPGVQYKTEKDAGHYAVTEAVADMFSYAGKKVEIASFDNGLYGIKNCFWNWTAEMFVESFESSESFNDFELSEALESLI